MYSSAPGQFTIGALMYGLDKKMKQQKNYKDFVKNVLEPQIAALQAAQKRAADSVGFDKTYGPSLSQPHVLPSRSAGGGLTSYSFGHEKYDPKTPYPVRRDASAANFYIDRDFEMKTPVTLGELVKELQKLEKLPNNPKSSYYYRNPAQTSFLANKLITRFLIKTIDSKGGGG